MKHDFKASLDAMPEKSFGIGTPDRIRTGWLNGHYEAIRAALELAIKEQEGYVLAPVKPTGKMLKSGAGELNFIFEQCCKTANEGDANDVYEAMINTILPTTQQPAAYKDPQGSQDD